MTLLNTRVAETIYQRIEDGAGDFWSEIYQPYSKKEISREAVLAVIEQARRRGATSMPKLARQLQACNPESEAAEEKKTFFRFKNFLYKTIRVN